LSGARDDSFSYRESFDFGSDLADDADELVAQDDRPRKAASEMRLVEGNHLRPSVELCRVRPADRGTDDV
jgi:hypothetical protein